MNRPTENDYPKYYDQYIKLTKGKNIEELIFNHSQSIISAINDLPNEMGDFAYAENKWTIKELLQHCIDTERIFVYRALRFSRKDNQALLGFEEDDYAKNSMANTRNLQQIKNEFIALRNSSNLFFASLTNEQLQQIGIASSKQINVNAIVFICFGHLIHHINILQERYIKQFNT